MTTALVLLAIAMVAGMALIARNGAADARSAAMPACSREEPLVVDYSHTLAMVEKLKAAGELPQDYVFKPPAPRPAKPRKASNSPHKRLKGATHARYLSAAGSFHYFRICGPIRLDRDEGRYVVPVKRIRTGETLDMPIVALEACSQDEAKNDTATDDNRRIPFGQAPHPSYNGDRNDLFPCVAPLYPDGVPPGPDVTLALGPGTMRNSKGQVVWIKTWNEKNLGHR